MKNINEIVKNWKNTVAQYDDNALVNCYNMFFKMNMENSNEEIVAIMKVLESEMTKRINK